MTKLAAVNRLLEWIGQPPVTALDPGGTSEEAEAEAILDRESRAIQARGWWCNTDLETVRGLATVRIVITGGAGTFSLDETVTESVSGATGTFAYTETSGATTYIRLVPATGTFTGGQTLTGGTSAATRTGGTKTTMTTSKIPIAGSWIRVEAAVGETAVFAIRDGYFWDVENGTTEFAESPTVRVCSVINFASLPELLADYVSKHAAYIFLRYKRPGDTDDSMRQREVVVARAHAQREDEQWRKTNFLGTAEARDALGNRDRFVGSDA